MLKIYHSHIVFDIVVNSLPRLILFKYWYIHKKNSFGDTKRTKNMNQNDPQVNDNINISTTKSIQGGPQVMWGG